MYCSNTFSKMSTMVVSVKTIYMSHKYNVSSYLCAAYHEIAYDEIAEALLGLGRSNLVLSGHNKDFLLVQQLSFMI